MYTLSSEQVSAYNKIVSFLSDSKPVLVLEGQAGTGKTFLMNKIVEYLKKNGYPFTLCAPTHKAKLVLETFTNTSAITLHSLLALSPDVEIFKLDYRQLKFKSNGKSKIPLNSLLIIDEASMITDYLYRLLLDLCEDYNLKILFIGDSAQIQGVNNNNISKVFKCPNYIKLETIYRQDSNNGLLPLLGELRIHSKNSFTPITSDIGNLFVYRNIKEFIIRCLNEFKLAINKEDITYTKLIAYTNARVQGFNDCIRKSLWKDNDDYHKYEFLTGYENFEYKKGNQMYNSLDYIIIDNPKYTSRVIPNYCKVPGYLLTLYDTVYKQTLEIFVLDKDYDDIEGIASTLEDIRFSALETKSPSKRKWYWSTYYNTYKSFAIPYNLIWDNRVIKKKTLDYGYSSTVHKIQGSSLNTVFIDMDNIFKCRNESERRQIQYVALSRTKSDAFLYF